MHIIKLIVTFLVSFICYSSGRSRYCDVCVNHTMCKYSTPGPNKECIGYDTRALINQYNAEEILNRVNEKRNFVAMGLSKKLPKAANMRKIRWSQELATFAQRWADQCSSGPDSTDQCRDLESIAVGQNVAFVMGPTPGLSVKAFVDIWFMQVLDYNGSISFYNSSQDNNTAFFTQLIWAETEVMGCAKVKYYLSNKRTDIERVICNFAPKGNIDGKPVYAIGIPSTQCPHSTKPDVLFSGLCANVTTSKDNLMTTSDPPITSLLRIINLSDHAAQNDTDPNRNINNKDHFNDRFQKIRHIFNNDDKEDFSQIHDAEEKIKDYLLTNTRENTFYDYILNINNQSRVTPKKNFFPSTVFRHDLISIHRGQTRSCTRSLYTENSYKKTVVPTVIKLCTRKRLLNKENKGFSVLQDSTRCKCNADCQNPAENFLENLVLGNRRRKVLTTVKRDSKIILTKPENFNYDYNIYKTQTAQSRYNMYLPKITMRDYRNYENYQKSLSSPNQFWFNRDKRKKRTQDDTTIKPFWQVDDFKPNNMPLLKSLRFTTLANKRLKASRRKTKTKQPITKEITTTIKQEQNISHEKYLSFEELMHLRKGNDANAIHFLHARRQGNSTTTTTKLPLRDLTTKYTTETEFQHVKMCTRKLTCTWTAIFKLGGDGAANGSGHGHALDIIGGGIIIGGGKGGYIIGGATRTPPGYVEGCTRTWTCTRPNFEKNKGPTSSGFNLQTTLDEDYCEKRALERRNLDENDYSILEKQSSEDILPSLYTTEPVPLNYVSSTLMEQDSSEFCPCNDESSRRRRQVETYDVKSMSITDSDLSYGDLFYLVVQKIINKFQKENCRNQKCICSKTTTINYNCYTLLLVYLFIFIKLFA